jgi:iron complex transport system permease protein
VFRTLLTSIFSSDEVTETVKLSNTVVWSLRLPRILMAMIVGAALASAGAVFQGCFRNPLVEPYILGVSSGAAFGAALGILFPVYFSVQLFSFIFGAVAVAFTYGFGRIRGETPMLTLILAGVITGSVFSAMVSILKYLAQDAALRGIVFWLMGGFYYATWEDIAWLLPVVGVCLAVMIKLGWQLNVLSLGDEEARSLGVNTEVYRLILIILATLVTAAAVSSVGIIAWVGLMMPHATRMLVGPDHRLVLPSAAAMGGIFLIICDTIARTIASAEIPIGIITSILGAPYLFYLLRTKTKNGMV